MFLVEYPLNSFYKEGIYVGYRYYDSFNVPTAYGFGYGLSYTTFKYSDFELSRNNFLPKLEINVTITNTGKVAGKKVVQFFEEKKTGETAMTNFTYEPSKYVPFRDKAVLERVRKIRREDIEKHPNPDYRIRVVPDADLSIIMLFDAFHRIKTAADNNEPIVMIMPNPWPMFRMLAHMLNKFRVDCRKLSTFNMDEYADQDGNIAPETWEYGFGHAFKKYFYHNLDKDIRPPEKQIHTFTNENINDYGKMISDLGEADIVYSGPGWTGHLAFIEPDAPEFRAESMEEWMQMGPRICTLSPFTLAQNSLHGSFGMSGDLAMVPPKAATIGPAQVVRAKNRMQTFGISVHGTTTSWQRLIARLVMHGDPMPLVPESVHQLLRTDAYVTETIAMNIKPDWEKGY